MASETQALLQTDDPFGGLGDFFIPPEAGWPESARRAVADYKALAEELFAALQEVGILTDFSNFKKVKKPQLEQTVTMVKGKVDEVLAFQPVLRQAG